MVLLVDFIYCDQIDSSFRISPNAKYDFFNNHPPLEYAPLISPVYDFKIDHKPRWAKSHTYWMYISQSFKYSEVFGHLHMFRT